MPSFTILTILKTKAHRQLFKVFPLLLALLFLFSNCKNDLDSIHKLDNTDTVPGEFIIDAEIIYSELGDVKILLKSPYVINTHKDEKECLEMPNGFYVEFFDDSLNIETTISANYGINYTKEKIMEAKGNVIVISYKNNERLYTEELIWDQRKRKIFSDVFVKIKTDDKILYGEGFEADENFKSRKIKKVSGELNINKNEL